ncbi:MAG: FAD binding domain-containing protein [Planctomycetota bacterium]|jgi:4-hydroxybenzoyl-CoA reductase subunit beta|nr:FAD binding domain-containing protein [Planctomycetota bacterium]
MLRLPPFELLRPSSLEEARSLLVEHGPGARPLAGGTDLLVNLKLGSTEAQTLVSLAAIPELCGIREEAGELVIGAMTPLAQVAASEVVRSRAPVLAQAASVVASPQLRAMGTLGGNLLLDTRCQWINQSHFWRAALGFCLKKDGSKCHVVEKGKRCVAAASNDTAPALLVLGARLVVLGAQERSMPLAELYSSDGAQHLTLAADELLVEVRVPLPEQSARSTQHSAYGKLRRRASIDFPLLGLAANLEQDESKTVRAASLAAVALSAKPLSLPKVAAVLLGVETSGAQLERAIVAAGALAQRRLKPLDNIPGDAWWRREMVPVLLGRTLRAALSDTGPVNGDPQ